MLLVIRFGIEEEKLFIQQNVPLELSNIENTIHLKVINYLFCLNIITTVFGEVNESWAEIKKPFQAIPKAKDYRNC